LILTLILCVQLDRFCCSSETRFPGYRVLENEGLCADSFNREEVGLLPRMGQKVMKKIPAEWKWNGVPW
jgi:hypothetical protein